MATISYPLTRDCAPDTIEIGIRVKVLIAESTFTGDIESRELIGADRWVATLRYPAHTRAQRAVLEAFWASVRGQVNRVALWPYHRPQIAGTLAGTLTLGATAAADDLSLTISGGTNGQTVKAGDYLGAGSQLFVATADATVSGGSITVSVAPRVRTQIASGQAVTTSRPTTTFMLMSADMKVPYGPGLTGASAPPFAVDLVEAW